MLVLNKSSATHAPEYPPKYSASGLRLSFVFFVVVWLSCPLGYILLRSIGSLNCFAVLYHSRQRYVEQASVPRNQVKLSVLVCEYCTIPSEGKSGFLYNDNTASPEAKAYQALPKPLKACCTLPQSAVEQN